MSTSDFENVYQMVSATFYLNKLTTARVTEEARRHPFPANFVAVRGNEERRGASTSLINEAEANAVVDLVCCSVLQCVAVCCSVLQCIAVFCSVLHCSTPLSSAG